MKHISDKEFSQGLEKETDRLVKWVDRTNYAPLSYFALILDLLMKSKSMEYYEMLGVLEDIKLTIHKEINEPQEEEDD